MEQAGWAQKTSILVGHSLVTLERLAILTPLHTIPMRDYCTCYVLKTSSREGGIKCGFGSSRLTAALRKKTALLFVNQASALAGKGHFSTQPPKCYAHR